MNALLRLYHKLGSPRWFYELTGRWIPWLSAASILLLASGVVWALVCAPEDYQQGNSFRVIYVHVPSAILAQSVYLTMAAAGLVFLVWRMKLADMVMKAIAPFGASMTVLALATGGLWGYPTWGTYWVWDGRTTSTLVLLFLYFGVMALRGASDRGSQASRAAALLAVVGSINIPIIKYSVDWWFTLHQPSTFSLTERPSMPPEMYWPLAVMVIGFYCLFALCLVRNTRVEILEQERRASWVQDLIGREAPARGAAA